MEYDYSVRTTLQGQEDLDLPGDVHIREHADGPAIVAVFDGEEQISRDFPPPQQHICVECASTYARGIRNTETEFLTSYDEREEADMNEITSEIERLIGLLFDHVQYVLGNGDFEEVDVDFEMVESIYDALSEMSAYVAMTEFQNLDRR